VLNILEILWISTGNKPITELIMEQKRCSFVTKCRDFKPHLLMVLVQFGYSFLYLITNASFDHGMNPFVYVTYRHILAAVLMFPFAYFLERYICICMILFYVACICLIWFKDALNSAPLLYFIIKFSTCTLDQFQFILTIEFSMIL